MNFKNREYATMLARVIICTLTIVASIAAAESAVKCTNPANANDLLKCIQENHPEVVSVEKINEVSNKIADQGRAWKNPVISFESLGGSNLGSSVFDSELRLSQAIELTGQRSARSKRGKALGEAFKADGLGKIEEITLTGVKSLFRLSQLKEEVIKIEESISKFKFIKNQYQARPRLNPEQEATLGIIQMAISEFEFRLNQANTERNELLTELITFSKLSKTDIQANLPKLIKKWPELPNSSEDLKSSLILKSKASVDLAKSELEVAKAEAWPEFTVDLIAQNKIDGSLQYQMFGAGISLPLPIFQTNQGEKSLKAVEFSKAQNIHQANLKKQEALLEILSNTYKTSVSNLNNTPSDESIEKKHKNAEKLFSQGMISGPLIVETHKQIIEYTQIRNQEELKAIEALWTLYILQGTFLDKKI